jgi:arginyl-tRNA synthetase
MSLLQYRATFVRAVAKALALDAQDVDAQVKSAAPGHGDFSYAAFHLSKALKQSPASIAAECAKHIDVPGLEVTATGPYVNARILAMPFTREVIDSARLAGERYGEGESGEGQTVVIDFSSPNIAKPIAFHHIRSTAIGHALANLYRAQGWKVEGINYLGDWGKQFGLVAVGFKEYGDPARAGDVAHLVEVYVKANERAEKEPTFDEEARDFFRRMECGDADALATWRQFRDTSVEDFKKVYARLGIAFDHYEGESRYHGKMGSVIAEVERTIGTKVSGGALVVDLPSSNSEPPVLLKKDDGSTLYATRDLAAAIDRFERFKFERSLYVVAADQALHFRQVFDVLEKMGKEWAKRCVHVAFGRVKGMSTRRGNLRMLTEVLDEAHARAAEFVQANISEGRIDAGAPDELAEHIGVGAVLFGDLKNRRLTDYEFDWEQVLKFEGHTGPYLQYAHARACSIILKAGGAPSEYDAANLSLPEEQALVREVARFALVNAEAVEANEPSVVSRYLLDLAASFSRWYTAGNQDRDRRVLIDGNAPLRAARLALTDSVRVTLRNGLRLLGLRTPERM